MELLPSQKKSSYALKDLLSVMLPNSYRKMVTQGIQDADGVGLIG